MRDGRLHAALAAAIYLLVSLWVMRAVLPAPATMLPYAGTLEQQGGYLNLDHSDQRFVVAGTIRNARHWITAPWKLFDAAQCHPVRDAVTLGEHMFGFGLLAVPGYLLSGGDPIATYNGAVVLTLLLPGLTMYVLVRSWTGSTAAALLAGFLFAFHPARVRDPTHPFVHGNQWTPIALLFAHRLFTRGRWRDAGGLFLGIGLQLLESLYQVAALAILGGVYGLYLCVRFRDRLWALVPKLLAVAVGAGAVAAVVLGPYLVTRRTWNVLEGRFSLLDTFDAYGFGGTAYPGTVVLGLAAVALVERVRRPRREHGYDPRLVYLAGGLLILWTAIWGVRIPVLDVFVPSPYLLALRVVPGLGAVRAMSIVRLGAYLVAAFLAGFGTLALLERAAPRGRRLLVAGLGVAAFVDVFHPPFASYGFPGPVELKAWEARPAADLLAMYAKAPAAPLLDLPFRFNLRGQLRDMADFVFLGGYHGRPVAGCYNSFNLPVQRELETLAGRLPDPRAADALHALGFGAFVVHEEILLPRQREGWRANVEQLVAAGRLVPLGEAPEHRLYGLASPVPVAATFEALAPAGAATQVLEAHPPQANLAMPFRNGSAATYRHPDPIEPTALVVRWYDGGGALVAEYPSRALLPVALGSGVEVVRAVPTAVPAAAGEYEVTVAPAATPAVVVTRSRVRVEPAAGSRGGRS